MELEIVPDTFHEALQQKNQPSAPNQCFQNAYKDIWILIFTRPELSEVDIISLSQTCKLAYRHARNPQVKMILCRPFKVQYKLTVEQFRCLYQLNGCSSGGKNGDGTQNQMPKGQGQQQNPQQPRKKKLIVANVGAGKTLIALAYIFRKYILNMESIEYTFPKPHEQQIKFDEHPPKLIFVAPPSNVPQWADAIEKFTNYPYMSTYSGAKNYDYDWRKSILGMETRFTRSQQKKSTQTIVGKGHPFPEMSDHSRAGLSGPRVILTSAYTLDPLLTAMVQANMRFALIYDECHHIGEFDDTHFKHHLVEFVGLTASAKKVNPNMQWQQTFHMNSTLLRKQLKPIEVVRYGYCGLSEYQRTSIRQAIGNEKNKKISRSREKKIFEQSMYGELLECEGTFRVDKKRFTFQSMGRTEELYTDLFLRKLLKVPKVLALVALTWKIKQRGDKLVVFDSTEKGLSLLHLVMRHHNIMSYVFSSEYNPKDRANQIKKFEENGDVLFGAVSMLAEGHNITAGNHVTFIGSPASAEQYKQAMGRVHRYPQEKQVYLHVLSCSALEEMMMLTRISGDHKVLDKSEVSEFLSEFVV